jgi:biopolymer transport protein ExbB
MRALQLEAKEARETLMRKAAAEKAAAEKAAAESRARIAQDSAALKKAVADLEEENRLGAEELAALVGERDGLLATEADVTRELADKVGMVEELVGVIRTNAKDIDTLIAENLQSALGDPKPVFLDAVAREARYPGMEDVRAMSAALWEQVRLSGEVSLQRGTIVDRAGREVTADILTLGPFTAAYRLSEEVGFLNHAVAAAAGTADGPQLYALSRLPARRIQKQLSAYMAGESEAVPLDISRGGALRQLTHELRLWEQIPKGGGIVWPILAILALGVLIILERTVFLLRRRTSGDGLIHRIEPLAAQHNWEGCGEACAPLKRKPLARVIQAGLKCCHMQREEMENALQEAILREIPSMERFLSTLGMLAAIAPLLGLLGTVTGMIDTFHVITLHGTGDPRLMSGGISEALVTTMLGLSVAIPLMLAHTLFNRAVERNIGELEEKAVALVNLIHKSKVGS